MESRSLKRRQTTPPKIPHSSLRGACCASDQLADLIARGRSFKRRDLSTIHPQQGRLVRADHIFRGAPIFGSLLRHGARHPCPCVRSAALLDIHRGPSQAPFFVLRNDSPHPLTCCSQHPRAYLGSCVGAGSAHALTRKSAASREWGRADRVIPVIVGGDPGDPERESIPQEFCFRLGPDGRLKNQRGHPMVARWVQYAMPSTRPMALMNKRG
jgi:hypothetical protein